MWHSAQPVVWKTASPARTSASIGPALDRRQELHEVLEIVDAAHPGSPVAHIFDPALRTAQLQAFGIDSQRYFVREQVVGDPHFIPIGVAGKRQQRSVLRLPAEPPDALAPRNDVDDASGPPAYAIAVAVVRVFQRENRLVGNRLHQSRAEERYRRAPRNHIRFRRNLHLAAVRRRREQVVQRAAVQCVELPILVAVSAAHLRHRTDAANRRHAVAHRATVAVESRAQSVLRSLHLREVVQPQPEHLLLGSCDPWQRTSRQRRLDGRSG